MIGLDFSLRRGDFTLSLRENLAAEGLTAIFGPSGAGKSTLLRAIAGFERTGGRVCFGDEVWEDAQVFLPPHRRRVGFLFQTPRLFGHLDVAGNLAYAARRSGLDMSVADLVARFGLGPLLARHPRHLSGGEAQRVALVRALLAAPRLLVMDEPLSALDQARRAEILPLIEELRDTARLPILYVSHALPEVARLAGRVLALAGGRAVAHGPTAEVLANAAAAPAFGGEEPGSLIEARVEAQEPDGLTRLTFPGGTLLIPAVPEPTGARLRLLVAARDVMLSRQRPEGLSALNVLAVTVTSVTLDGAGSARVGLDCGGAAIAARVTARSVAGLCLAPGVACHAVLKSVALARD